MPVSDDNEHGDNDDNDGGFDNEDGECSLSTNSQSYFFSTLIFSLLHNMHS